MIPSGGASEGVVKEPGGGWGDHSQEGRGPWACDVIISPANDYAQVLDSRAGFAGIFDLSGVQSGDEAGDEGGGLGR